MTEYPAPHEGPSHDPAQLPLGVFDGLRQRPPDAGVNGADAAGADGGVAVREPPVCGEWSNDAFDDGEGRPDSASVGAPVADAPRAAAAEARAPGLMHAAAAPSASPAPSAPPARPPAPAPSMRSLRTPIMQRVVSPSTPLVALTELKSVHESRPGDAKTAMALANALDSRGNIEGALSVLLRAIDAGADGVLLRCARATLLSNRLRYDDAESELKKASKLRGGDPDVLLQQGILACRRAKWRDAVEPLEQAAKLSPQSGPAHFYLGEALNKLDRLSDALVAFERASELEPGNWRALKGVGIVLDRMERPGEAAEFYRRARDAQSG